MINVRKTLLLVCGLGLLLFPTGARAEKEYPFSPGGIRVYKPVTNWKKLRDQDVVKQKFDYSCGSGALATLMLIGFDEKVNEAEIMKLILEGKSAEEIEDISKRGYSLLDLKQAAEKKGYTTGMYKLQISQLHLLQEPVLIYIERHGLKHFAVFKGLKGDRVYLADPARGNVRVSIYRFEKEWPGYILAIDKK
jgi:predicted double-glycine peptidase